MGVREEVIGIANRYLNDLIQRNAPEWDYTYTPESWYSVTCTFDSFAASGDMQVFNGCRLMVFLMADGEDHSEMMLLVGPDNNAVEDVFWAHDGEVMTVPRKMFTGVTL